MCDCMYNDKKCIYYTRLPKYYNKMLHIKNIKY